MLIFKSRFSVLRFYDGMDTAPDKKVTFNFHLARLAGFDQIVQDFVGHGFVKGAFIPVTPEIELEALQLHAEFVRDVGNPYDCKIRLAGFWADTGKFRAVKADFVVAFWTGVGEDLKAFGRFGRHGGIIQNVRVPAKRRIKRAGTSIF